MRRLLRRRRFARDERGAVLVEFGLVLPIFLIMFCAMLDFGFAIFTLNAMAQAVREGGRYAAVLTNPVANDPRVQARTATVFNGLRFSKDSVSWSAVKMAMITDASGGQVWTVTIPSSSYSYKPFTPFAKFFGMGAVPMGRRATFRSEWEGSS